MLAKTDLQLLAETRLREAKVLKRNKLYDGAAYLCGYVVELSLKAAICSRLNINEYPDSGDLKKIFSSHEFDRLLLLAGLRDEISLTNSKKLFDNWSLLTDWKPERRYLPIGSYSESDVKAMLDALTKGRWGVYNWIQRSW